MTRTDRRRAVIVFALGTDAAADLIGYATEVYGDESFAIDYIHTVIARWVEREQRAAILATQEIADLINALSDRASTLESALRAIHEAEVEEAVRRGWR